MSTELNDPELHPVPPDLNSTADDRAGASSPDDIPAQVHAHKTERRSPDDPLLTSTIPHQSGESSPAVAESIAESQRIRFDASWKSGGRPVIEDYLANQSPTVRSALFRHLLDTELAYRRKLGEQPRPDEYIARFAADAAEVHALFSDEGTRSGGGDHGGGTVVYVPVPKPTGIGRYVVKKFHARGGMGEVFLAEDHELGREVALKRLGSRTARSERFLVEARVTGQLEHPGIVPVHDLGVDDEGRPFYIMKFVRGRTLKDLIAETHADGGTADGRAMGARRLLGCFVTLCQTVAYAHSRGVVHRDLKPDNVMVGDFGETILLDWGLGKVIGGSEMTAGADRVHVSSSGGSSETVAGSYLGSPPYMPPEFASGHADEADEQTDVYLLGATLYEILTARPPRQGSSMDELLELARTVDPVSPRQLKPTVPAALAAICLKAMARRKVERYRAAGMLAQEIERDLADAPVTAYKDSLVVRARRWARRHRRGVERAAIAAIVLAASLAGLVALQRSDHARATAQQESSRLARLEQGRTDLIEFRRLSDQAHFFAASVTPDDDRAPFYDHREAEAQGRAALAKIDTWGPDAGSLPIPEERDSVRRELYDLLLLLAQLQTSESLEKSARQGIAWLDRARSLHEPTRSYYRIRARCDHILGNNEEAESSLRQANDARTPAVALDHFLAGESERSRPASKEAGGESPHTDVEGITRAVDAYRLALELDPDHYWSHFQLGRCYLALGRGPEAIEALGTCVSLRPDVPWGYSARGLALGLMKRYPEAMRDLDRASAQDFRPARLNRGVLYALQKRPNEALAEFEAVLQPPTDRRLIEAAYYRGQLYLDQGRDVEAIREFDRVLTERPDFRLALQGRAQAHLVGGDKIRGEADFNRGLALANGLSFNSESAEAYRLRGRFLRLTALMPILKTRKAVRKDLRERSRDSLKKSAELGDQTPDLFVDLGAVQEQLGRAEEAAASYTRAVELAPEKAQALVVRGWVRVGLKQYDLAQRDFVEAIGCEPSHAEAHTGLGYVHACKNGNTEAQREAVLALLLREKAPRKNDYIILHNVACIYAQLAQSPSGETTLYEDQSIALLKRAIELWKRQGSGLNEIEAIKGEIAFTPSLRARVEFKALLDSND